MSMLLSRPLIINHSCSTFTLPNLHLEDSAIYPGLPSPFTHMALEAQLCRTISLKIGEVDGPFSTEQVLAYQREGEDWLSSFPLAYSITEPDTS